MKNTLLIINIILLVVGNTGGPLLMRLYFIHGGNCIWFSAFLGTAGFPIILIILLLAYFLRNSTAIDTKTKYIHMKPRLFIGSGIVGILTGTVNYFYTSGGARLPVSTLTLVMASQLAFTALSAYILVRQKFTSFSINAVVLLTIGAGVLAMHTSSDRPEGESKKEYVKGFIMTIAAAALYGLVMPLVELVYNKAKQSMTYTLVLEFQTIMCFFSSIFCVVGMLAYNEHKVISKEAREYGLGESRYYVVLIFNAILWQCSFLGIVGVIFCSSSLLCGILIAVLLPVTEVLAVIFYQEKFQAEKGIALVLSLWGFISYFYGEFKENKKKEYDHNNSQVLEILPSVAAASINV